MWPLHWAGYESAGGVAAGGRFSREVYPRVYAWMEHFDDAVRRARGRNTRGVLSVKGEEAARLIVRWERERDEAPSMGIDEVGFRPEGGRRGGRLADGYGRLGEGCREVGQANCRGGRLRDARGGRSRKSSCAEAWV